MGKYLTGWVVCLCLAKPKCGAFCIPPHSAPWDNEPPTWAIYSHSRSVSTEFNYRILRCYRCEPQLWFQCWRSLSRYRCIRGLCTGVNRLSFRTLCTWRCDHGAYEANIGFVYILLGVGWTVPANNRYLSKQTKGPQAYGHRVCAAGTCFGFVWYLYPCSDAEGNVSQFGNKCCLM